MTKKLEELLDLPPAEETPEAPTEKEVYDESKDMQIRELEAMGSLEKIEDALPSVKGLEASDKEMDDLADLATGSYKDLVDLGMNVEARFSAEILNTASSFLGHAITAKTAKINKKLKMVELQLRQAKLQADTNPEELGSASGSVMDRNELLEQILKRNDADKKAGKK